MKITQKFFLFALFCASLAHCLQPPSTQLQLRGFTLVLYPANHGSFYHKERAKMFSFFSGGCALLMCVCFYCAVQMQNLAKTQGEVIPRPAGSLCHLENAFALGGVFSGTLAAYCGEKIMYHRDRAKEARRTGHCGCH